MPGYLTLHQSAQMLAIKWTPNQLMKKNTLPETATPPSSSAAAATTDGNKSVYWNSFLSINVQDIVYVHCHQAGGADTGGTIILVEQDGIQRPPIHFPKGGHMAAFLSCLETGLLPHGQLDPPLWSQRGMGKLFAWPPGAAVPKGSSGGGGCRRPLPALPETADATATAPPIDYVFRIVNSSNHREFREFISKFQLPDQSRRTSILQSAVAAAARGARSGLDAVSAVSSSASTSSESPRRSHLSSCSTNESSEGAAPPPSSFSGVGGGSLDSAAVTGQQQQQQGATISLVCSTMRRQIISRAFYGWLAYCRHRTTVRTHLSGLVHGRITPEADDDRAGLTKQLWDAMHDADGAVAAEADVLRLAYFGGVEDPIRREVWPYLLGHHAFGSTRDERSALDAQTRQSYEQKVGAWMAVEAIVRQLDKEKTAQAYAKLSSESGSERHLFQQQLNKLLDLDVAGDDIENDVFEENAFSDLSDPEEEVDEVRTVVGGEVGGEAATTKGEVEERLSRANKSSTDSGNVPDVETESLKKNGVDRPNDEGRDGENECEETEKNDEDVALTNEDPRSTTNATATEESVHALDDANPSAAAAQDTLSPSATLQYLEHPASNKSTPTTSSYETVTNDFGDMIEPFAVIPRHGEEKTDDADADTDDVEDEALVVAAFDVDGGAVADATVVDDDDGGAAVDGTVVVSSTPRHSFIVTDASVDIVNVTDAAEEEAAAASAASATDTEKLDVLPEEGSTLHEPKSACVSPASSGGGVYSVSEL